VTANIALDRYASRRSTVYANRGMVATSQPLAAEVGVSVLRDGGNAFDAAVATAATLNVVEATSTGLGGDVFALYRTADGEVEGMQSCGGAAADATLSRVRDAVADGTEHSPADADMPRYGPHTVTVPGTARGWERVLERHGRRSLADALAPAIEHAVEGFPVTEVIANRWTHAESLFTDEHAREAYLKDGAAPDAGEQMCLPRLGESLQRIAEDGADVVYEGDIGEAIVEEVQSKGGFLSLADLAAFEPEFVDPIATTYRDADIYELPPSNQGLIALEALTIAEELGAGEHQFGSTDRVHFFVEAMKRAFEDGHRHITDREYEEIPDLLDRSYASDRAGEISRTASTDVSFSIPDSDTVLLITADEAGNVVSFINSRFAGFGSGLVAGQTGIALQNRGSSFSLDPDHPNRIEPGKRPFHTLIPALARLDDDDWMGFGVMGGPMQPQGHVQVVSNVLDYDRSLQAALDEPRWQYMDDGTVAVEARMDDLVQTELCRRGHDVRILPPQSFGGGQIVRNDGGTLSGATDPRKDGIVVGY
jgi:gamma-glutamyltranspeptidase/glutathione hydrolase